MCFSFFKKNKKSELELLTERQDEKYDYSALDALANYGATKKNDEPTPAYTVPTSTESATTESAPKDYSFSLQVNDESGHGRSRTVHDPSETDLDEAARDLTFNANNFIVFESASPINDCTYIQANGYDGGEVYVEIQHIEFKNGKKVWTNYYKMLSIEALRALLKEFAHKNTPNLYGWDEMMSFDENGDQV